MKICEHNDTIKNNLNDFQIYKDECDKCFITNLNEDGINLCLLCYNSFCKSHNENHSKNSKHFIYLNIKKKIIKEENIDKPTTLGINCSNGFNNHIKEEFTYKVFCEECKVCVDEGYEDLIKNIESSNSAYKVNEISAFEFEINPCAHSREKPSEVANKVNINNNICHKCDKKNDLWFCLTCGLLSCSRSNYDGSGGNNHGVEHFEQTGHNLSIKIFAIDFKNNSVSIHCYACGDDVKDEFFVNRITNLGIDINSLKKTEKSILEINIDMNLTLDLSKTFEKNKNLTVVSGKELTGIQNIGNSCYINSCLQLLLSIDEIRDRYLNLFYNHNSICDKRYCFTCQFSKIVQSLSSGNYCKEDYYIKPFMFKYIIGKNHIEFKTNRQQDVFEYFQHLLSIFNKNEKEDSCVNLFKFEYKKVVECNTCKHYYLRENKSSEFLEIPILYKTKEEFDLNFQENLNAVVSNYFTNFEELCLKCNKVGKFNNYFYIDQFPQYLILKFNIYYLDNFNLNKIDVNIKFNDVIDLGILKFNENKLDQTKKMEVKKEEAKDDINLEFVNQLMNMGFTENRSKRALLETNNNLENALNVIMANLDDKSYDLPLNENKPNKVENEKFDIVWGSIKDFGLDMNLVKAAVEMKDTTNTEVILNFVMESPQEIENYIIEKQTNKKEEIKKFEIKKDNNSLYHLKSSIVHLGKSTFSGHYVSYSKKNDDWILFNDEKVAIDKIPSLEKSYMVLLKKNN